MNQLNSTQLETLRNDLKARGLSLFVLKDELLDHICCLIELEMEKGISFDEGRQIVFKNFNSAEMLRNQKKTKWIYQSKKFKRKFKSVLSAAAVIMLMMVGGVEAQETPDGHPIYGDCELASGFGIRRDPIYKIKRMHSGIDFKAKAGTPVVATADGTVLEAVSNPDGYGNKIIISHSGEYKTLFGHLSGFNVKTGDKVRKGDIIGYVGSSGRSSAPHLHYEILQGDKKINPELFISK
ncbi:MAG: M23 family metallopeptidase [bacterium]|nr:M23 family metallopeptidase [bacterium]